MRSRAPAVKTKISQTILPESPEGSEAPVGFINTGSLADRLPNKGSAQADSEQLMGQPKYPNNRPEGRSNHRPEGLAEEEQRPFVDSGPPLRPEGLAKTLLPTLTPRLRPGYVKTLLTALLRLAQPEPTGTNRPGTPAQKGPGNERRKQSKAHKSNHDTRDRTLYTCRNNTLQPP